MSCYKMEKTEWKCTLNDREKRICQNIGSMYANYPFFVDSSQLCEDCIKQHNLSKDKNSDIEETILIE